MGRKYINRKLDAEDEWSHITGDISEKIDTSDAMNVEDRTIFFGKEQEESKTNYEKTKEATRNAMDRAGNTGQYIKYVNAHLEKQNDEINRIKKIKAKFDQEVDLLAKDTSARLDFDKIPKKDRRKEEFNQLRKCLVDEKSTTQAYLNQLKSAIHETENVLEKQEKDIKKLDHAMNSSSMKTKEDDARIKRIKEDLLEISQKYDPKTLIEIINMLEDSAGLGSAKKSAKH